MDGLTVEAIAPDTSNTTSTFTFNELSSLAGFINANASKDSDKLSMIAEFLRGDKKEFSDIDLLSAARSLETRLGFPKLGETRLDQLYAYAKISRQISDLEKARNDILI